MLWSHSFPSKAKFTTTWHPVACYGLSMVWACPPRFMCLELGLQWNSTEDSSWEHWLPSDSLMLLLQSERAVLKRDPDPWIPLQLHVLACGLFLSHQDATHPDATAKGTLTWGCANRHADFELSTSKVMSWIKLLSSYILQTWVFCDSKWKTDNTVTVRILIVKILLQ